MVEESIVCLLPPCRGAEHTLRCTAARRCGNGIGSGFGAAAGGGARAQGHTTATGGLAPRAWPCAAGPPAVLPWCGPAPIPEPPYELLKPLLYTPLYMVFHIAYPGDVTCITRCCLPAEYLRRRYSCAFLQNCHWARLTWHVFVFTRSLIKMPMLLMCFLSMEETGQIMLTH